MPFLPPNQQHQGTDDDKLMIMTIISCYSQKHGKIHGVGGAKMGWIWSGPWGLRSVCRRKIFLFENSIFWFIQIVPCTAFKAVYNVKFLRFYRILTMNQSWRHSAPSHWKLKGYLPLQSSPRHPTLLATVIIATAHIATKKHRSYNYMCRVVPVTSPHIWFLESM